MFGFKASKLDIRQIFKSVLRTIISARHSLFCHCARASPIYSFNRIKCKYSIQSLTGGWKATACIQNICILRNPTERT